MNSSYLGSSDLTAESLSTTDGVTDGFRSVGTVNCHVSGELDLAIGTELFIRTSGVGDADTKNAARYRFLRACRGQEHDPPFTVVHEMDGLLWGGDLDAAIDEERATDGVTGLDGKTEPQHTPTQDSPADKPDEPKLNESSSAA